MNDPSPTRSSPTREIAVGTLGTGKTTFLLTKALLTREKTFVFDVKNDISLNDFPSAKKIKKKHPKVLIVEEPLSDEDFRAYYDRFGVVIFRFDSLDLSDYARSMNQIWAIARERKDDVAVFLDEAEVFNQKGFLKQMNWLSTKSRSRNISVYATATRLPYVDRALRDNATHYYCFYTTSEATLKELEEMTSQKKLKEIVASLRKFEYYRIDVAPPDSAGGEEKE